MSSRRRPGPIRRASTIERRCWEISLLNHRRWLWVPPFAGTTIGSVQTQLRDLAAPFARGLPTNFLTLQSEGAGNAGRRCARSRVCSVGNTRVSHHGHTGNTRHSPRNGFNGFLRDLPGDRACLSPSSADTANLTPASRRQDHTTSPSAASNVVSAPIRPPHPAPTSVTFAKRPSVWDGMGRACRDDLPDGESGIFLRKGLDRKFSDLPVGPISRHARPVRDEIAAMSARPGQADITVARLEVR